MYNERHFIRPFTFDITDIAYRRIIIWTLILLGCALYAHTLQFPFVWDGRGYILGNPLVKDFGYFSDIFNINEFAQLDEKFGIPADIVTNFILRPITYFTFSINYHLGGNNPAGYRAGNIGIHIFNAAIIYLLLEKILGKNTNSQVLDRFSKKLIPTATALLFLVHPLQTESVIYITQRFTSLATGFYLLTAFLYLCSVPSDRQRPKPVLYWASVATLLTGMLTKEIVFTAPFMLLIMEIVILESSWKTSVKRVLPHLLCLPVIPVLVMLTSAAQSSSNVSLKSSINVINFYNYSIGHYALTQLCAITTYIRLILLPYGQNADHDFPLYTSLVQGRVFLSLTVIVSIVAASVLIYRRKPKEVHVSLLFFGVIFFFISISVTSSIIPMAELLVERRTYLPSFGAFLALVCAIDLVRIQWRTVISRQGILAGFMIWLSILCGVTYARSEVWRSAVSFWQATASQSPNKLRPMFGLATAYYEQKQYGNAILLQKKIMSLRPDDLNNHVILAELQYLQGLYTDAIETGVHALSLGVINPKVYYFLGLAYSKIGVHDDAEQALKYALTLEPSFLDAHLALAGLYSSTENYADAIQQYRIAEKLDAKNKNVAIIIRDLESTMAKERKNR